MNKDRPSMSYLSQDSSEDLDNDETESKGCKNIHHISRPCQTPVEELWQDGREGGRESIIDYFQSKKAYKGQVLTCSPTSTAMTVKDRGNRNLVRTP